MKNTFSRVEGGADFSFLFNQWNLLEHTVMDFNAALLKVFSTNFQTSNDYKNKGLVLHVNELKNKQYSYEEIENIFDAYYLQEIVGSYFEIDGEIEELLSKFYNLEKFKCNFVLDDGEKVNFDFTHNNNTLKHYINGLTWFFDTGYFGDIQIEYID